MFFTEGQNYFHAFGRNFPFTRETKEQVRDEMQRYADEVIARREKIAGRKLSDTELLHGIQHPEDRGARQRAADSNWHPTPVTADEPVQPSNPFAGEPPKRPGAKETRAEFWERSRKEYEQRQKAEAAEARFRDDPRRVRAVAHAEEMLERVLFDPTQPQSAVERAKQRVRQAREGALDVYREMDRQFQAEQKERRAARVAEANAKIAEVLAEVDAGFEPDPEPDPQPVEPWRQPPEAPKYVRKLNLEETRKWDEERRAREAAAK